MKLKLSAIALLAMIMPAQTRAATLTDAEATFLDQLVTAATVLAQRCTGYEVNGAGGVQRGAKLLGRGWSLAGGSLNDGLVITAFRLMEQF